MPRSLWTGTITFGLVNIPVRLLSADGSCRLRRKLYCPETGKEYDMEHTSKGYEIAPDQYVIITKDELKALEPEAGRTVEITEFVELTSIDPIYFDRTYYLLPDEGGAKAYALLLAAMRQKKRIGVAQFVMRQRQHLAAIRPAADGLILHTRRYADEITALAEFKDEIPEADSVDKKQLQVATQLVEALSAKFEPQRYHDEYRAKLRKIIEQKAQGEAVTVSTEGEEEAPPPTYDIMSALNKSIAESKKKETATKHAPPRRRKSA